MAQKPKAGAAKTIASPTEKQKAQSERFLKAAREAGVDETGREFERALRKLAPPKRAIKS